MSECCYTHGETTEAEDPLDPEEGVEEENSEVEGITSRIDDDIEDSLSMKIGEDEDEKEDEDDGRTTDDADTVLLAPEPSSARTSPSITERSYCIYNPPPSPADSS